MKSSIVITFPIALGSSGGSPIDCMQTAIHLHKAGVQVTVMAVSTMPSSRFPGRWTLETPLGLEREALLRDHGVSVVHVQPNPIHAYLDGIAVKRALGRTLATQPVDAVLGFWQEAAFLPGLLRNKGIVFGMIAAAPYSMWFGRPHLGVANLLEEPAGTRSTTSFVGSLIYRALFRNRLVYAPKKVRREFLVMQPLIKSDVIFARSNFTRMEIIKLFDIDPKRVQVAYCGIDPLFARIGRKKTQKMSRFIFYGAFVREKGIFDAIAALGRVAARGHKDWTIKIIGWGDKQVVQDAVQAAGIAPYVELLNRMDHHGLARELESAQLAILPTYAESFGLAIAEAQASGLPVVAYKAGAVPEVIEDRVTGWLVPLRSIDLLAEAIIDAIENPDTALRMGLSGRERSQELFSWEHTAETIQHGIETTIAKRGIS